MQVAEGLTWRQVARLAEAAGVVDAASFAEAVRDPELLGKYGVPFPTAEGFLFPETYLLPRSLDNDARPVVEVMLKEFRRRIDPLLAGLTGQGGAGRDLDALRRLVVLASLAEKETAAPEERARVAGVYAARLERGMLLQCDPTVIYGLGEAFDGNLRRRDLDDETNLYNTYRHGRAAARPHLLARRIRPAPPPRPNATTSSTSWPGRTARTTSARPWPSTTRRSESTSLAKRSLEPVPGDLEGGPRHARPVGGGRVLPGAVANRSGRLEPRACSGGGDGPRPRGPSS